MEELWKAVPDFEGKYSASTLGEVKNETTGKLLNKYKNIWGYHLVCLNGKLYSLHRIIAKTFIPNPNNLPQVNHKNEIKTDSRAENLEWISAKDNTNYGTCIQRRAEKFKNGPCSKAVLQFSKDGEFIKEYPSTMEAQRQTGISNGNIGKCCMHKPRYNTAGGYKWEYKEKGDT